MTEQEKRKDFVESLRKIADLFENNETLKVPLPSAITIFAHSDKTAKQEARDFFKVVGAAAKQYDSNIFHAHVMVGELMKLQFMAYREQVCEKVVIGKRSVEAKPEIVIPASPATQEDIVEWRCGSILSNQEDLPATPDEQAVLLAVASEELGEKVRP